MFSVTGRISSIQQPRGGYVPSKLFEKQVYDDGYEHLFWFVSGWDAIGPTAGSVVDYLSRYMICDDKYVAFEIPILGAMVCDSHHKNGGFCYNKVMGLLDKFCGLDDDSIRTAVELVSYDVYYRTGDFKKGSHHLSSRFYKRECELVRIMVQRVMSFFEEVGPVVSSGFTFDGGYTDLVSVDDYWTYVRTMDLAYPSKPFFKYTSSVKFLKNNGFVMFISISSSGSMCVLNGASKRKCIHDVDYYYENLSCYGCAVLSMFSSYWKALYELSNQVKNIRSDESDLLGDLSESRQGRVHGCIVDLDFWNHLYLNPYDGTLVPYFAYSMCDKYVYKNVESLLADKRPDMLSSFRNLLSGGCNLLGDNKNVIHRDVSSVSRGNREFVRSYETDMYAVSNRLRALQRIYDYKYVGVWYDEVLVKKLSG